MAVRLYSRWSQICKSCFLSGMSETSIGQRSLEGCKEECDSKKGCKTINYGKNDQSCWLVDGKVHTQTRDIVYDDNDAYSLEFGKDIHN